MTKGGYIYIMTNKPFGVVYVGVTSNIANLAALHRSGRGSEFCRKWGLTKLVLLEWHGDISTAIAREKTLKKWHRLWKLRLISEANPNWDDLYDTFAV